MVESRTGAVAWAIRHHPVSRPRSSNRTCGFPASGFPTGFIARHTAVIQRHDTETPKDQITGKSFGAATGYLLPPFEKVSDAPADVVIRGCHGITIVFRRMPLNWRWAGDT